MVSRSRFPKGGFRDKEDLEKICEYSIPIYFGSNGILEFPMTLVNKN